MQVMLMRLMSKGEYLIVPKGTKFKGLGKLGLRVRFPFLTVLATYPTAGSHGFHLTPLFRRWNVLDLCFVSRGYKVGLIMGNKDIFILGYVSFMKVFLNSYRYSFILIVIIFVNNTICT